MYIQPNQNNINMYGRQPDPNLWKYLKQKVFEAIPDVEFKNNGNTREKLEKYNQVLARPVENRLVVAGTALLTQPVIDYCNHRVDKETREVSACRTIAKIIAGTLVGIIVRGGSYKLVQKMTNINGSGKYSKAMLPNSNIKFNTKEELDNYRNAASTILAITAMCVTNFIGDAPLTLWLTNVFNNKRIARAKMVEERRNIND